MDYNSLKFFERRTYPRKLEKLNIHSFSVGFKDLKDCEMQHDYMALSNRTVRHVCRTDYCLKSKLVNGEVKYFCRFGSEEWELLDTSQLIFVEVETKKKDEKKFVEKIIPSRNDVKMTEHNRLEFQHWKANINVQLCLDVHGVIKYTTKFYTFKII